MTMMPVTRPNKRRQAVIETVTRRDFDGGWDVIDNEFSMSPEFSVVMQNVRRAESGTIDVRWGTRLIGDLTTPVTNNSTLGSDPLATTTGSAVITVTHTAHGLISGHVVTIAGATAVSGIPANEINTSHTIAVVSVDTYTIVVSTTASGDTTGGGASITVDEANNGATDDFVNVEYFQDRLVAVLLDGSIIEMDDVGVSRIIWNNAIAVAAGAASGWSATSFASFAVFGADMIVCNGVDKPVLVNFDNAFPCNYLVDLGSVSNTNTPIGRYVLAMNNYTIIAGDYTNPGRIHISNSGTSGTYVGDSAPNDATYVDVDKVVQAQNGTIRGLSRFRDFVVVAFDDVIALGQLGIYDSSGNHTPDFTDAIRGHGTISHRSMVDLGDDLLMCDQVGVPSLARATFTGTLRPDRVSELIDPEIRSRILNLSVGSSEDRIWAVHNRRDRQYMLFIPDRDSRSTTTEMIGFALTKIDNQKVSAWSEIRNWNFDCGCRTSLDRVILCSGRKYYVYGSAEDPIYADLAGDPDIDEPTLGNNIDFAWELPWADFDRRMNIKQLRHIGFDIRGRAEFGVKVFTDDIYRSGTTGALIPALSQTFTAIDPLGFGAGYAPFGGEVCRQDERLRAWTTRFKLMKLRIDGSTRLPLRIVSVSFSYQRGSLQL